ASDVYQIPALQSTPRAPAARVAITSVVARSFSVRPAEERGILPAAGLIRRGGAISPRPL
ncbi:MAG: hypothetical protein ACKOHG_06740, partial [Planctomycetia bacterium]